MEYKLVAMGTVRTSNGTVCHHGEIICGATMDELTPQQEKDVRDMLGCVNVDFVSQEEYERTWKETN